jgi:hypothetical protein
MFSFQHVDDLAGPLFDQCARMSIKFLQAESNAALDKMLEAISPSTAVNVIVVQGAR